MYFWKNGFYNDSIHKDIPLGAVPITDDYYQELIGSQSEGMTIVTGDDGLPRSVPAWEVEDITTLKKSVTSAIHAKRAEKMEAGIIVNGNLMDSDDEAVKNVNGAALLAVIAKNNDQPFSVQWTTAANEYVEFDGDQMIAFANALGTYISEVHYAARAHKDAVAVLRENKDVISYDYEAGWPEIPSIFV